MSSKLSRLALVTAAGLVCLFINDNWSSTEQSTLITPANARIGNPLSPGSIAGVNRRVERRAYRRGYYGGGYYGGGYYGPGAGAATVGAAAVGAATVGAAATGAGAYVAGPGAAPAPGAYPPSAPGFVHDAIPVQPGASATVTDPATGRTCTIQPNGYQWCWTP